ncbi:hypothetical protein BST61_g6183 [Cercospora zeina]
MPATLMENLCNLEVPAVLQISPSADHVLYSTNLRCGHKKGQHARSTLWLADMSVAESARHITSGQFKDHFPRWHPDGQSIAFVSDRAKAGEQWAVYLWNLRDGVPDGEPHALTDTSNQRQIAALEFSPDGKRIAYLCADPETPEHKARREHGEDWQVWGNEWVNARLNTVDVETKVNIRHAGDDAHGIGFNDHVTALTWCSDSLSLAVAHTRTSHIEEPRLRGSQISLIRLSSDDSWYAEPVLPIPTAVLSLIWGSDEKLYFTGGVSIDKVCCGRAAYSCNVQAGAEPSIVAFGIEDDVRQLVSAGGMVVGYAERGLRDVVVLLPDRLLCSQAERIGAFGAASKAGGEEMVLAIAHSDLNTPSEVYSVYPSSGEKIRLSNHGKVFRDRFFGSHHPFSCQSLDKEVDLDGIFLTPSQSSPSAPQPTAVLIHGGPPDRSSNEFDTYLFYWTPFLLHHGYSVLLTNYRGSTGKGDKFASYSLKGCGKYDWEDVVTITNHAISLNYADQERLVVGGISQGGFLTYLASTRNGSLFPWKFRAAIPLNGFIDVDTMALTSDLGASLGTELDVAGSPWRLPRSDTRNRQASAIWEVGEAMRRAKAEDSMVIPPMLIMHSEKDERCPIEQAVGMRRALSYYGLPFEFVVYPRQPHLPTEQKFWIDMAERLLRCSGKHTCEAWTWESRKPFALDQDTRAASIDPTPKEKPGFHYPASYTQQERPAEKSQAGMVSHALTSRSAVPDSETDPTDVEKKDLEPAEEDSPDEAPRNPGIDPGKAGDVEESDGASFVLRFLQGFFGSPCLATGGASLQDMYRLIKLPYVLCIWAFAATCGPALGPLIAGFSVAAEDWRWSLWEMLWLSGPVFVGMLIFLPETSTANILLRRAQRLRKLTGDSRLKAQSEIDQANMRPNDIAFEALVRPLQLVVMDPAVAFTAIYIALCYGIYYSFFEAFPLVYIAMYGFNLGELGLTFLSITVGVVIAIAAFYAYLYYILEPEIRKFGLGEPERRLIPALIASFLCPIGLFIFGWTADRDVHWMVSVIGIMMFTMGIFVIMQCIFVYLPLVIPQYAASLFAGNDFARSTLAFAAVLFSRPMYINLNIGPGTSLLGGLTAGCIAGVFALYFFGKTLRARSRFSAK